MISCDTKDENLKILYEIVDLLRKRANINKMPEVGVYISDDINAFATGRSKNNALIAFSSSLLQKMDDDEISAVAAHEIAHIANGDMITLSVVQSVANAIVLLISIPLSIIKILALFSDKVDWVAYLTITFIRFIVVSVMLFLANLVVKAFSRKREFEADKLAASLLDSKMMIKALNSLKNDIDTISFTPKTKNYSALKINAPLSGFGDIFSTHPSLDRRINALSKQN